MIQLIMSTMSINPQIAIPMFIIWIISMVTGLLLFLKKRISYKQGILVYLVNVILAGFVLGGTPNTVAPIQQIMTSIKMGSPLQVILPLIVILLVVLLSSLFFGRLFCSFACPLGQYQELFSKIQFKSDFKKGRKSFKLSISKKYAILTRWIFFAVILALFVIWNIGLVQIINPFMGFSIFTNPMITVVSLPVIILGLIGIASIFVYRPWCTLFCPFGAFSSLVSRVSRLKIQRTENCNECGLCEKICPTEEAGADSNKSECYLCRRCIEICPQNALKFGKSM